MIEYRSARIGAVDFDERTIEVIAVPYGEEITVEVNGKIMREVMEPGVLRDIDPQKSHITVNRDHSHERVVGRVIELREDKRGAVAVNKISRTDLGEETLQLAADGILGASVGAGISRAGMEIVNGLRRVFRISLLDHIAMLPNPAYSGARVLGVRSAVETARVEMPNLESVLAIAGMSDLIRGQSNAPWRG